jgi:hypothetical protein
MKRTTRFFAPIAVPLAALALTASIAATGIATTSCDVLKQVASTYNMVNCKYDFRSLTGVSVAGINVSQGLSLLDAPKIMNLLSGNAASIPVNCTVNLAVQNPNATDAILNGMDYALAIDGVDFTSGSVAQQLSVAPGGEGTLPLAMAFDVATLLKGESRDAVMGVVRNLAGLSGLGALGGGSSEPSQVTLNIRPSFNVAGTKVSSPVMIPVSFSFGGK